MALAEAVASTVKSFQDDKKEDASSTSLQPKDFFWDQFIKYISSAVLALTVLNVSVEFLRGGGVQCFSPAITDSLTDASPDQLNRDFTRSQSDYLNSYCSESVPNSEFFSIFVIVQGILLVAPHFIWGAVFKGDFDSFFAVTEKLDRLRDRDTGAYDSTNFDRVEKLELEFGCKRKRIFACYILKLLLQLGVCVGTILFSENFFEDFLFSFQCPRGVQNDTGFPENWPLATTVPCVFVTLRVLNLVRYGDYILIGLAIGLILMGLAWCAIRHAKELGHMDIATFVFQSCLPTKSHVFPHPLEVRPRQKRSENCWFCIFPFALLWPCCKGCLVCSFRFMLFTPRIRNDLDFLQMTLFRADSSHGRVFKEIQIDKELKKLRGRDHQLIHLFLNVQLDMEALIVKEERKRANDGSGDGTSPSNPMRVLPRENDMRQFFREGGFSGNPEMYAFNHYKSLLGNTEWKPVVGIRDRLYGFVKFCPAGTEGQVKTDMAMDISFGSSGYGLVLARAFKTVVSVNFQPFLRNAAQPVKKEKYYTNYINVDFPENIFTRNSEAINQAVRQMVEPIKEDGPTRPIDFIVVGPIEDDHKRITVTLQIEMLYTTEIIEKKAILLAVRPLKIGHRKTTKRFLRYEPPVELFDHDYHGKTVLPKLEAEVGPDFRLVDGQSGITVNCGDIECIFEFVAYQYTGETTKEEQPGTTTLADLIGQADEDEAMYDNDEASSQVHLSRSQSVPVNPRHSENDQEDSSLFSPPPVHPQRSELQVGGVYDLSQHRAPPIQRRNTVDGVPRPTLSAELQGGHNRLTQVEQDFSPRAREMKMKLKHSMRTTLRKSISVAGSSDRGAPDDNQPMYATESATSGSRTADTDESREPDNDRATGASEQPHGPMAGDVHHVPQQTRPFTRQQHVVQPADANRSRLAQSHPRCHGSSSSSRPLLSSIEESSGTSDENESVTSPPPVLNDCL